MAYFIIKRHCEHKNTGLRPAPGSVSHLLQHHAEPFADTLLAENTDYTSTESHTGQETVLFCSKNSAVEYLHLICDYTYQGAVPLV